MKDDLPALGSKFPPLLSLTFVLQQSADELLQRKVGLGLGLVRIMSGLSPVSPCSQRRLASYLGQTEANISRQLKILKGRGLVNITKNKKDARQRDVILTKKGEQKYLEAEEILVESQPQFDKIASQTAYGFN